MAASAVKERKPATANVQRDRAEPRDRQEQLGQLYEFIGFNLRIAQEASFRTFARKSGLPNLKPGRFAAMMVIRQNPGVSPVVLSRLIGRDKSSITPLIQDLERQGLVKRTPSKADRRSVSLTLTRSGETDLDRLLDHARAHDRKLDAIVGKNKAELVRILREIADALD